MKIRDWTIILVLFVFSELSRHDADSVRVFYNIAHMANDVTEVEKFLAEGANGLEIDVEFSSAGRPIRARHGFPCDCFRNCLRSEVFSYMLRYLRDLTIPEHPSYVEQLALIFLDLRVQAIFGENLYHAGERLAEALLVHLFDGGNSGSNAWVVLSVPSPNHAFLFRGLRDTFRKYGAQGLLDRIGYDIGSNMDMRMIERSFDGLGISDHLWIGDGVTNCLVRSTRRLQRLVEERDVGESPFDRVYHWTVDTALNMRQSLRMGIDAIITNQPGRLLTVLEEDEFYGRFRLATPDDRPWEKVIEDDFSLLGSSLFTDFGDSSSSSSDGGDTAALSTTDTEGTDVSSLSDDITDTEEPKDGKNCQSSSGTSKPSDSDNADINLDDILDLSSDANKDSNKDSESTTTEASVSSATTSSLDDELSSLLGENGDSSSAAEKLLASFRSADDINNPFAKSAVDNSELIKALVKLSIANSEAETKTTSDLIKLLIQFSSSGHSTSIPARSLLSLPSSNPSVPWELVQSLLQRERPSSLPELILKLYETSATPAPSVSREALLALLNLYSPTTTPPSIPLPIVKAIVGMTTPVPAINQETLRHILNVFKENVTPHPLESLINLGSSGSGLDLLKSSSTFTGNNSNKKKPNQKNKADEDSSDSTKKQKGSKSKLQGRDETETTTKAEKDADDSFDLDDLIKDDPTTTTTTKSNTKTKTKTKDNIVNDGNKNAANLTRNFPFTADEIKVKSPSTTVVANFGPHGVMWRVIDHPGGFRNPNPIRPYPPRPIFPGNIVPPPIGVPNIKTLASGIIPSNIPIPPVRNIGHLPRPGIPNIKFSNPITIPIRPQNLPGSSYSGGQRLPNYGNGFNSPPHNNMNPYHPPCPNPNNFPGIPNNCQHFPYRPKIHYTSNGNPVHVSKPDIVKYSVPNGNPGSYYTFLTRGVSGEQTSSLRESPYSPKLTTIAETHYPKVPPQNDYVNINSDHNVPNFPPSAGEVHFLSTPQPSVSFPIHSGDGFPSRPSSSGIFPSATQSPFSPHVPADDLDIADEFLHLRHSNTSFTKIHTFTNFSSNSEPSTTLDIDSPDFDNILKSEGIPLLNEEISTSTEKSPSHRTVTLTEHHHSENSGTDPKPATKATSGSSRNAVLADLLPVLKSINDTNLILSILEIFATTTTKSTNILENSFNENIPVTESILSFSPTTTEKTSKVTLNNVEIKSDEEEEKISEISATDDDLTEKDEINSTISTITTETADTKDKVGLVNSPLLQLLGSSLQGLGANSATGINGNLNPLGQFQSLSSISNANNLGFFGERPDISPSSTPPNSLLVTPGNLPSGLEQPTFGSQLLEDFDTKPFALPQTASRPVLPIAQVGRPSTGVTFPPSASLGWNGQNIDVSKLEQVLAHHTPRPLEVIIIENNPHIFVPHSGHSLNEGISGHNDESVLSHTVAPEEESSDGEKSTTKKRETTSLPTLSEDEEFSFLDTKLPKPFPSDSITTTTTEKNTIIHSKPSRNPDVDTEFIPPLRRPRPQTPNFRPVRPSRPGISRPEPSPNLSQFEQGSFPPDITISKPSDALPHKTATQQNIGVHEILDETTINGARFTIDDTSSKPSSVDLQEGEFEIRLPNGFTILRKLKPSPVIENNIRKNVTTMTSDSHQQVGEAINIQNDSIENSQTNILGDKNISDSSKGHPNLMGFSPLSETSFSLPHDEKEKIPSLLSEESFSSWSNNSTTDEENTDDGLDKNKEISSSDILFNRNHSVFDSPQKNTETTNVHLNIKNATENTKNTQVKDTFLESGEVISKPLVHEINKRPYFHNLKDLLQYLNSDQTIIPDETLKNVSLLGGEYLTLVDHFVKEENTLKNTSNLNESPRNSSQSNPLIDILEGQTAVFKSGSAIKPSMSGINPAINTKVVQVEPLTVSSEDELISSVEEFEKPQTISSHMSNSGHGSRKQISNANKFPLDHFVNDDVSKANSGGTVLNSEKETETSKQLENLELFESQPTSTSRSIILPIHIQFITPLSSIASHRHRHEEIPTSTDCSTEKGRIHITPSIHNDRDPMQIQKFSDNKKLTTEDPTKHFILPETIITKESASLTKETQDETNNRFHLSQEMEHQGDQKEKKLPNNFQNFKIPESEDIKDLNEQHGEGSVDDIESSVNKMNNNKSNVDMNEFKSTNPKHSLSQNAINEQVFHGIPVFHEVNKTEIMKKPNVNVELVNDGKTKDEREFDSLRPSKENKNIDFNEEGVSTKFIDSLKETNEKERNKEVLNLNDDEKGSHQNNEKLNMSDDTMERLKALLPSLERFFLRVESSGESHEINGSVAKFLASLSPNPFNSKSISTVKTSETKQANNIAEQAFSNKTDDSLLVSKKPFDHQFEKLESNTSHPLNIVPNKMSSILRDNDNNTRELSLVKQFSIPVRPYLNTNSSSKDETFSLHNGHRQEVGDHGFHSTEKKPFIPSKVVHEHQVSGNTDMNSYKFTVEKRPGGLNRYPTEEEKDVHGNDSSNFTVQVPVRLPVSASSHNIMLANQKESGMANRNKTVVEIVALRNVSFQSHPKQVSNSFSNISPNIRNLDIFTKNATRSKLQRVSLRRPLLPLGSVRQQTSNISNERHSPFLKHIPPHRVTVQHKGSITTPKSYAVNVRQNTGSRSQSQTGLPSAKRNQTISSHNWHSQKIELEVVTNMSTLSPAVIPRTLSPVLDSNAPHTILTIQPSVMKIFRNHPSESVTQSSIEKLSSQHPTPPPFHSDVLPQKYLETSTSSLRSALNTLTNVPQVFERPGLTVTVRNFHESRINDKDKESREKQIVSQILEIERKQTAHRRETNDAFKMITMSPLPLLSRDFQTSSKSTEQPSDKQNLKYYSSPLRYQQFKQMQGLRQPKVNPSRSSRFPPSVNRGIFMRNLNSGQPSHSASHPKANQKPLHQSAPYFQIVQKARSASDTFKPTNPKIHFSKTNLKPPFFREKTMVQANPRQSDFRTVPSPPYNSARNQPSVSASSSVRTFSRNS